MRSNTATAVLAALAGSTMAAQDERTFAVLGFNGNDPLTEGCVDPIVSPGERAAHAHTVMGASNFGLNVTAEDLAQSECTNANVPGDNSAYWMPKLYFQDPTTGKLEDVKLYYAKIYYFMDPTDDDIEPFPPGLQILSGNASTRTAPASGGDLVLDPEDGQVQPAQWTCPQADISKSAFAADSDGSQCGIKNPASSARDFGSGFPTEQCDRQFSPLRADLHFPSCYDPEAGLEDWENNMAWPSRKYEKNGSGRANCPPGHVHVPHLFFEFYWDTIEFMDRWTVDGVNQPFILANGDRTGFSLHGDFIAGWDTEVLADIIANCNAGSLGMDKCVQGLDVSSLPKCTIESPIEDVLTGVMDELPCGNSIVGWGVGDEVEAEAAPVQVDGAAVEKAADAVITEAAVVPVEAVVNGHVVTEWVIHTVVMAGPVQVGGHKGNKNKANRPRGHQGHMQKHRRHHQVQA